MAEIIKPAPNTAEKQVQFPDPDIGYNVLCEVVEPEMTHSYKNVCYATLGGGEWGLRFQKSTHLVAYFFYSPCSPLTKEKYERYWREVVLPSIPESLLASIKLEDLTKEDLTQAYDRCLGTDPSNRWQYFQHSFIPWKKITFDTSKHTYNDFFVLGVLTRQICEYSTHWDKVFRLEKKHPDLTLEQLSFLYLALHGDGHTLWAANSMHAEVTLNDIKKYSTQKIWNTTRKEWTEPMVVSNRKTVKVSAKFSVWEKGKGEYEAKWLGLSGNDLDTWITQQKALIKPPVNRRKVSANP